MEKVRNAWLAPRMTRERRGRLKYVNQTQREETIAEENRGSEPWQDVVGVRCDGSFDVAMAKLVEEMLKQC